jgi:hypothetical protein
VKKSGNDNLDKNSDVEQNNNVPGAINANLYSKLEIHSQPLTSKVTSMAAIESEKETDLSSTKCVLDATSPRQFNELVLPETHDTATGENGSKAGVPSTKAVAMTCDEPVNMNNEVRFLCEDYIRLLHNVNISFTHHCHQITENIMSTSLL